MYIAQLMPLPLTVSCLNKIQIGFTFLVPAHLGSLGQMAVKRVCVCVSSVLITNCIIVDQVAYGAINVTPGVVLTPTQVRFQIW